MTKPAPQSTEQRAFVDARFLQSRVVSESVTSMPARPSAEPQQLELRTEVASTFAVGVNDVEKPTEMFVEVEYRVDLKLPNGEKILFSYSAKHAVHYKVVGWTGFAEWPSIPEGALGPYFSMAYALAHQRAEQTILDMGLKGVVLPRANTFDEYSNTRAQGIAA